MPTKVGVEETEETEASQEPKGESQTITINNRVDWIVVEADTADDLPVEHTEASAEASAHVEDALREDDKPVEEAETVATEAAPVEAEPEGEEANLEESTSERSAITEESADTAVTVPGDFPATDPEEELKDDDIETTAEPVEKLQNDDAPVERINEVPDKASSEDGLAEEAEAEDAGVVIENPVAEAEESSKQTAAEAVVEDDAAGDEHKDIIEPIDTPLAEIASAPEVVEGAAEDVVTPEEANDEAYDAADAAPDEKSPIEIVVPQDDTPEDLKVDDPTDDGNKPEEASLEGEKPPEDTPAPVEVVGEGSAPAEDPPSDSAPTEETVAADEAAVVEEEEGAEKVVDGAAEALTEEAMVEETVSEVTATKEAPSGEPASEAAAAAAAEIDEPAAEAGDEISPPTSPREMKSRRRKKHHDEKAHFWERERQMSVMNGHKARLDRRKQEKGLFVNTFAKAVDRAKEDQAARHESPEYLEKQEERRQRHEKRDHLHREERRLEKEAEGYRRQIHEEAEAERRRRREDEKEAARVASMAEKEKEVKYLRDLARRKDRSTSFNESSEGHSSSGTKRPALLKRVTSGESDTGRGLLLMVNPNRNTTSKARETPRSEPVKVERREHRRRQDTKDGSGSSTGSGKGKAAERPTHSRHHSSRSARNMSPPPSPVMKLARAITKILA